MGSVYCICSVSINKASGLVRVPSGELVIQMSLPTDTEMDASTNENAENGVDVEMAVSGEGAEAALPSAPAGG